MQGYVQIYTGNGKGKTTAALGLALRAVGAGLKVYFGQFLKKGDCSEIKALRRFPEITVRQFGCGRFVKCRPTAAEIAAARRGLASLENAKLTDSYVDADAMLARLERKLAAARALKSANHS